jgi:hypothetical protein
VLDTDKTVVVLCARDAVQWPVLADRGCVGPWV